MTPPVFVVDTNVIVSAPIGSDGKAPLAEILEAMLDGGLLYLMSGDLLTEYASVLRRPRLFRPVTPEPWVVMHYPMRICRSH